MKTLTVNDQRIFGIGEKVGGRNIPRATSSRWKNFLREISASFAAPFESDWDKKCGLHWREWGKL